MPSPTTTNITVGSILEILSHAALSTRGEEDHAAFDALLKPPRPSVSPAETRSVDAPESTTQRSDEAGASETVRSQTATSPSATPQSEANAMDEQAADQTGQAPLAEGSESLVNEDESEERQANTDEEAEENAAAGAVVVPVVAPVLDVVTLTGSELEDGHAEEIAPAAATVLLGKGEVVQTPGRSKRSEEEVVSGAAELLATTKPVQKRAPRQSEAIREDGQGADQESKAAERVTSAVETELATEGITEIQATAEPLQEVANIAAKTTNSLLSSTSQEQEAQPGQAELLATNNATPEAPKASNEAQASNQPVMPTVVSVVAPAANANQLTAQASSSSASATAVQSGAGRQRSQFEAIAGHSQEARRGSRIEVDTTRLISRVARAFQAAQQRDGEIRLRLSPPELGSLRLLVQVQDGVLVARLETETAAARTAVVDNLPALRERLAEQGVRIERFDVDLMQQQSGGMPDRPRDQDQGAAPVPRAAAQERPRVETSVSPRSSAGTVDSSGRLNVII